MKLESKFIQKIKGYEVVVRMGGSQKEKRESAHSETQGLVKNRSR